MLSQISLCHAILHYDIRSPDALSADAQIRASAEAYCNSVPFEMLVLQSSDDLADLPLYCSGGRGGMPTVFLDDDDGSSPRHECAASARAHCVGALDAAFAQRLANSMLETTWSKEGGNDGWTIIREAVASVLPVHLVPRLPLPQPDLTFTIRANPDLWAPADGDLPRERFGGVDSDSFGASYEDTHASSEGTGNSKESEHSAQKEQQQQQQQHKASAFELSSRIELLEAEVSGLDRNLSSKQQARARLGACLDELDNTMTSSSAAAGRANKPCAPFVPHAVLDRAQSGSSSSGSSDGGGSGDEDAQLQVRLDKYANQI